MLRRGVRIGRHRASVSRPKLRGPGRLALFVGGTLILAVLAEGCKTSCHEESFSNPFDAEKVARRARESYQEAWNAEFWARRDLRMAAFHPTRLDRSVIYYLDRLTRQVSWLATEIERNPTNPRCASKGAYDIVAFDTMMLKERYRAASFRPSTDSQIQKLLGMIDEISSYYKVTQP
jgi:hypothetical protein